MCCLITQRSLLPMPGLRTFAKTEMPNRFAFFCAIPLFLCTSAFAQSTTPAATTAERTFWDHNGSVMYLVADGSSREFYYQKPRPGMLEVGAHPDSLLFKGQINDGQFSGTAYLFNAHCGQVPFEVKGADSRQWRKSGADRAGSACRAKLPTLWKLYEYFRIQTVENN